MSRGRISRGDIVRVEVPYLDASRSVRRPALVVGDPSQMLDLIVAMITSRIRDPLPPTHYRIDQSHPDWSASGLRLPSVVRCDRLYTMEYDDVQGVIGCPTPRCSRSTTYSRGRWASREGFLVPGHCPGTHQPAFPAMSPADARPVNLPGTPDSTPRRPDGSLPPRRALTKEPERRARPPRDLPHSGQAGTGSTVHAGIVSVNWFCGDSLRWSRVGE